ncbi:S66 family peptidase [Terrabacter sp. 2RAF25]|uniref:S66 family peptidase n=1 Tax=Terrabacter sp. 2RAF25 TaxID=3232998 RepID=UPI003F99A155
MTHEIVSPRRCRPGDKVAVLSPSWAAPALFPAVHDQAMRRLRDELGLEPVEYPTTRALASPAERAGDLMTAFADPDIRAVMATIGGDDQITVLRHLDPDVVRADPKPFLGYSDNTNLLNWLWFHGIEGVHGGSTQVHLGPGPSPDAEHLTSLRAALFGGDVTLAPVARTRDMGLRWDDPAALTDAPPDAPAEPWTWSGPQRVVTGQTWGGNIEILRWTLEVGRFVRPVEAYAGCVLALEASEEMPSPEEHARGLRNLGERGVLGAASALLWARPFASGPGHERTVEEASAWRAEHRDQVLRAVAEYNPELVVALDVDFGHTSPQWVLPYGGQVTVDGVARTVTAHFS